MALPHLIGIELQPWGSAMRCPFAPENDLFNEILSKILWKLGPTTDRPPGDTARSIKEWLEAFPFPALPVLTESWRNWAGAEWVVFIRSSTASRGDSRR